MFTLLIIFQVLIATSLIGLILVQQGKGADMGAAFGSGASGTVFGSKGSTSFLTKATAVLAVLFFVNSLILATPLIHRDEEPASVTDLIVPAGQPAVTEETMPAPAEEAPASDLPEVPE